MFFAKKDKLIARVERLKAFVEDLKMENAIENINSFIDEIKKDFTFNVLVLGDFSSGKSTFINRFFIKKDVLPTNVTTTTAKLTILKYALQNKVVIEYKDGKRKEFKENFESVLKESVSRGGKYIEDVELVEVYVNSSFLGEGIIIVDSPGLNDPETERMKVTLDFIDKADSVLYLLTALQAWKKSEKEFIEEKILKKEDLDKVFFILNFWDMIEKNERESLIEYVKNEMRKSLEVAEAELGKDISEPPLIPVSAKTCENFDVLEDKLISYLASIKGDKILLAKKKKFLLLKNKIRKFLEETIKAQRKEVEEINNTLNKLKEEVETLKEDVENFKASLKEKIGLILENFINNVGEVYDKMKEEMVILMSKKCESLEEINQVKPAMDRILHRVLYSARMNLSKKYEDFIKDIEKIVIEEKSKLNLDKYFLKKDLLTSLEELKKLLIDIDITVKANYVTDGFITGTSVALSLVLANINPTAALIPISGILYNFFLKKKEEKKAIFEVLERIEDELESTFNQQIFTLEQKKEEIVDFIVEHIRNELIEAYLEKEKIYREVLANKRGNNENKILRFYKNKIEELEKI